MKLERLLFASCHGYLDPSSGASICTRDMLELLAARGIDCRALTTGLLAAESAITGFAQNSLPSALATYSLRHRQLYRRRAWVNTLLRWLLTTPSRPVRLLRSVDRLPGIVAFLSHRVHATT